MVLLKKNLLVQKKKKKIHYISINYKLDIYGLVIQLYLLL